MATSIIKPVHAGIDLSFTIPVSGWSSTAPYTYTWTDSRVTSGCRVEAGFFSGATDTSVAYLEYEKVTGGVQFTSPVLPTVAIPVIVHIINAQTGNTTAITGDMVQTDVISGAANVDEALNVIANNVTTTSVSKYGLTVNLAKYGKVVYFSCNGNLTQAISNGATILTFPEGYRPSSKDCVAVGVSGTWTTFCGFRVKYTDGTFLCHNALSSGASTQVSGTFVCA